MCGRFSQIAAAERAARMLDIIGEWPQFLGARYNVAPSQYIYAIRQNSQHENVWAVLKWGLLPFWAKDKQIASRLFNARAETVDQKPSFRAAFRYRRCIVPVDDYFEWQAVPGQKRKQPFEIRRRDGQPLFLAGLWELWENGAGEIIESCSVLTTEANAHLRPIHGRMPVILPYDEAELWLDSHIQRGRELQHLLVPWSGEELEAVPVEPDKLKTG